jgi:hypothetical protein
VSDVIESRIEANSELLLSAPTHTCANISTWTGALGDRKETDRSMPGLILEINKSNANYLIVNRNLFYSIVLLPCASLRYGLVITNKICVHLNRSIEMVV